MMNREEKFRALMEWRELYFQLSELNESLSAVVGNEPQMPIREVPWIIFNAYTTQLAHRLGCWHGIRDVESDLHWFWHECRMGSSPKNAGTPGLEKRIESLDDLLDLIDLIDGEASNGTS